MTGSQEGLQTALWDIWRECLDNKIKERLLWKKNTNLQKITRWR